MPALADREQYEAAIVAELAPIFEAQFHRALEAAAPLAGPHATRQHAPVIPWAQFRNELTQAMTRELSAVFQAAAFALPIGGTIVVTEGTFSTRADQWAANMAREISSLVVETSQGMADQAWQLSGGDKVKFGEAMALVFMADARIEGIAITEVTRAVSAGERAVVFIFNDDLTRGGGLFSSGRQRRAGDVVQPGEAAGGSGGTTTNAEGEKLVPIWKVRTIGGLPDSKVCRICVSYWNHGPEIWGQSAPGGPPAHPHDRCWLEWITVSQFAGMAA